MRIVLRWEKIDEHLHAIATKQAAASDNEPQLHRKKKTREAKIDFEFSKLYFSRK